MDAHIKKVYVPMTETGFYILLCLKEPNHGYGIVQKVKELTDGDIVLAIVDNEFTLKTYKKDEKGVYLKPENSDYPIIRPKHSLSIFGVAIGIARRF